MSTSHPSGDPDSRATNNLTEAAERYQAALVRERWRSRYGVHLEDWLNAPKAAWEVETIGDAEKLAGAEIGDLAVLCDVHDRYAEHDTAVKSKDSFRGVYTSRSEPKVRCYYFRPLD